MAHLSPPARAECARLVLPPLSPLSPHPLHTDREIYLEYSTFCRHLAALVVYFFNKELKAQKKTSRLRGVYGWALRELDLVEALLAQVGPAKGGHGLLTS